jgi:hypothetical protein
MSIFSLGWEVVSGKAEVAIVRTWRFANEVEPSVQARIIEYALKHLNAKTDMVVFYPYTVPTHYEDEGRTLVTYDNGLKEHQKVYAVLSDLGDPSQWEELYGREVAEELRRAPNCRFVATFMLADEY